MLALPPLNDLMRNTVAYEPRHSISSNSIDRYNCAPSHPPDISRHIEEEDDKISSYISWESSHLADDNMSPSDIFNFGIAILADTKYHFTQQRQQLEVEHQSIFSGLLREMNSSSVYISDIM